MFVKGSGYSVIAFLAFRGMLFRRSLLGADKTGKGHSGGGQALIRSRCQQA